MRILVLQLCRMGDLLQTTPMLRGLRRRYPEANVTLVVLDAFADAPIPKALYDRLMTFPARPMVDNLSGPASDWPSALECLREFVAELDRTAFDLVLNLTPNDLCGLLTSLISGREIHGGFVAADRTRVVRGSWMTYFWSSQKSRADGCFNLVDIHNKAAGVPCLGDGLEVEIPLKAHEKVSDWLRARGIQQPPIAVQLGASEERKQWPPERFAEAVDALPAELGQIVLVGTPDERALADRACARAKRPLHVATGETTLAELAALLARCRLLMTNDTGTMHVASAVGLRVLDISTGPVFVHETGPYGAGHLAIESRLDCFPCAAGTQCHHYSCRDSFTPADVAALARYALGAGPQPMPAGARILAGGFARSGRLEYRPIWPTADRVEDLRAAAARVWESTLPHAVGERVDDPMENVPGDLSAERRALLTLEQRARQAGGLAERLTRTRSAAERRSLAEKISTSLRSLSYAAQTEPAGGPIANYLQVALDCCTERDVARLSQVYVREFSMAADRARRLAACLGEGTVRPHSRVRIRAIESAQCVDP